MSEQNKDQVIEVTAKDLPLYCPGPNSTRWNMHPRVFFRYCRSQRSSCYLSLLLY